jgi:mannose-6-phosphate isomerase-like protein (cupin superfamily)
MIVTPPGGGEVVGDTPDRRVEILAEHDRLHATWTRFGPHRDGADLHIHRYHTDLFYVLAGELTVRLADAEVQAPVGSLVVVPPLVVHGFRNDGDEELRYLNFHAPGMGFADYMRRRSDFDQEDPPANGARPSSEATIGPPGIELDELGVRERMDGPSEHTQWVYVLEGSAAGSWIEIAPGEAIDLPKRALNIYLR